jgi:hypothetical protein
MPLRRQKAVPNELLTPVTWCKDIISPQLKGRLVMKRDKKPETKIVPTLFNEQELKLIADLGKKFGLNKTSEIIRQCVLEAGLKLKKF